MTKNPVVHVVVAGEIGGAERMLADLVRGSTRRHSIALLTPNASLRRFFVEAGLAVDDRGPVRENPISYLARSLGPLDVRWLERVLAKRGASIVHLHTFGSQVLGTRAALRRNARIVRTEHSTRVYDDRSCWPFSRWSLKRADIAVAISEHVRSVAARRAPWADRKLRVVPNGVDVDRFVPEPLPEISSDRPIRIVAIGRLDPRKGFDTAIAAIARVPGVELEIVGEGSERANLVALTAKLGLGRRVRLAGFASDVRNSIARAHLVVSSARAEGLGIALLEAMAVQRAVVALPTGGVPEVVDDGTTGWLATGSDSAALARAIERAVANPEELRRRSVAARKRVVERFSLAAMSDAYERIYEAL